MISYSYVTLLKKEASKLIMEAHKQSMHKFLEDVSGDKCFWVYNGPVVRNIYELADALEHMSQSSFEYHVNGQKNDFSNWIEKVLGDKELASRIMYKSRHETASLIKKRLLEVEDDIEQEKVENVLRTEKVEETQSEEKREDTEPQKIEVREEMVVETTEKPKESRKGSFFTNEWAGLKEALKNNLELFLLGLIFGILIGKFVLGNF